MRKSKGKGSEVGPTVVNLFDEHSRQTTMTTTERGWRNMKGDEVMQTGRGPI